MKSSSKKRQSTIAGNQARSCFISAPAGTNLETIRTILHESGLRPIVASDLIATGAPIIDHLKAAISRATLLLAIVGYKMDENVYFEIGLAAALGARVLVLAQRGAKLPTDMASMFCIRTEPQNREAISFALDQFLMNPKSVKPKPARMQKTHPIGDRATDLIEKLDTLGNQASESDLLEIVSSALSASGLQVVVESKSRDKMIDLAVWADELGAWAANPLAIEIKRELPEADLRPLVDQISAYLPDYSWALVLYLQRQVSPSPPTDSSVFPPTVMFLKIRDLLDQLRTQSFARIVRDLRNKQVHQIGL